MPVDGDAGVEVPDGGRGGVDLAFSESAGVMNDLTLEVGDVYHVGIDQSDPADACRREVETHW